MGRVARRARCYAVGRHGNGAACLAALRTPSTGTTTHRLRARRASINRYRSCAQSTVLSYSSLPKPRARLSPIVRPSSYHQCQDLTQQRQKVVPERSVAASDPRAACINIVKAESVFSATEDNDNTSPATMSLVPLLFSDWWEDLERPHSVLDQHFGLTLDPEDLAHRGSSIAARHAEPLGYPFFRRMRRRHHPYHHALVRRPGAKGASVVQPDKDKFLVTLDVQQFAPEEISVKVVDKCVVIEAKHEEKEDDHGWISRQFTRKYSIPAQCDVEQIESTLSSDGVLTITAPRKKSIAESNERNIKIMYTGAPAILDHPEAQNKQSDGHADENQRDHPQQRAQMGQRGKKVVKGA